jgi:hypothetical protein
MISSDVQTQPSVVAAGEAKEESPYRRRPQWLKVWICLLLACTGASWFSYQYFLEPQPARYAPSWQRAQWVQAADGNAPAAYFRSVTDLNALPDAAFVTVAASQVFRLYVNGVLLDSNERVVVRGNAPLAYIYSIAPFLRLGPNVIGFRVANLDLKSPALQVSVGMVQGHTISYSGTGATWQATAQSALAHPRYAKSRLTWAMSTFDASSWPPARVVANPPASPLLTINPLLYEQPLASRWLSAGASHDAFFVRTISLPAAMTGAWLRIVASGPAEVYINGKLSITWDGQVPERHQETVDYLSDDQTPVQYNAGLTLGIDDISPYLHAGINTIAVHVSAPGFSAARVGAETLGAALLLDMLTADAQGHDSWLGMDSGWHVSTQPVAGWAQGNQAALAWPSSSFVGRPGASRTIYLPDSVTPQGGSVFSFSSLAVVILLCVGAVIGFWLLMSLIVMRRFYRSRADALGMLSLAYMPALACEALLIVLSLEAQLPQPFPYTWQWGVILLLLVGGGYLLLYLYVKGVQIQPLAPLFARGRGDSRRTRYRLLGWLRAHWGLVVIVILAIPLICYNLPYEPFWQDELTSYYAAKGILAHGIPVMPSGYLYAKGELYSYVLAISIKIFGEANGALRLPSVIEYLVSLPIFYGVACYFFDRRIALLATAMLALSPFALRWGQSVRMYEQAQLLTILDMYLFYKALQERRRVRLVYLAVACLVATYLSHEESFIILPALVVCVLVFSRDATARLPWVVYQKHWWYAAAIGVSIIGLELLITKITHPPVLGTDQSQQPLLQITTDNLPYYLKLLFFPAALSSRLPWITVNSLLVLAGCVWALRFGDARAKYCALFLLISLFTLVFMLTLTADRYIYPLLPAFYMLAAYAVLTGLRAMWKLSRSYDMRRQTGQAAATVNASIPRSPLRLMIALTTTLVCASVLILPMLPVSGYDLFVSQQAGLPYHRYYPDYDAVGQYMHQHWREGDVVIAVSPAISVLYYVGHVDYFFSVNRALYLFERDGRITDTPTGSTPLLSQADFQSVLARHARVWIISDNGLYQAQVRQNGIVFPPGFRLVYEGYGSAVYLRGGES